MKSLKDFKNIDDVRYRALVNEFQEFLRVDRSCTFANFCKIKGVHYESMKRWIHSYLNTTITALKRSIVSKIESQSLPNMNVDFVQVVPAENVEMPVEKSVPAVKEAESKLSFGSMHGVSIVCPNGLRVCLEECSVESLSALIRSFQ